MVKVYADKHNDKTGVIDIFGSIGEDFFGEGNTFASVRAEINELNSDNLIVNIASFGGALDDGLSIHNFIKSFSGKTTMRIVGDTASSATVISSGGDTVEMSENHSFLIHNAFLGIQGNSEELDKASDHLKEADEQMAKIFSAKTGKTKGQMLKLMAENRWLSAKEAKEVGLVDKIIPADEQFKAVAKWDANKAKALGLPELPNQTNKMEDNKKEVVAEENTLKLSEKLDGVLAYIKELMPAKAKAEDFEAIIASSFDTLNDEFKEGIKAAELKATEDATKITELEASIAEKTKALEDIESNVTDLQAEVDKLTGKKTEPKAKDGEGDGREPETEAHAMDGFVNRLQKKMNRN